MKSREDFGKQLNRFDLVPSANLSSSSAEDVQLRSGTLALVYEGEDDAAIDDFYYEVRFGRSRRHVYFYDLVPPRSNSNNNNNNENNLNPRELHAWIDGSMDTWRIDNYGDAVTEVIHTANIYHSDRELIDE